MCSCVYIYTYIYIYMPCPAVACHVQPWPAAACHGLPRFHCAIYPSSFTPKTSSFTTKTHLAQDVIGDASFRNVIVERNATHFLVRNSNPSLLHRLRGLGCDPPVQNEFWLPADTRQRTDPARTQLLGLRSHFETGVVYNLTLVSFTTEGSRKRHGGDAYEVVVFSADYRQRVPYVDEGDGTYTLLFSVRDRLQVRFTFLIIKTRAPT
jgi:hypothetical protein